MVQGASRLAFRHLLAVILVTLLVSAGELLYEVRTQYTRGVKELEDVLETIEDSYVPSVAAGVFFFDDHRLTLLAEGIALLPYVDSVTVLERRSGGDVPIVSTGTRDSREQDSETHTYPLRYEYDGDSRAIGSLHVTTNLAQLREQIARQLRVTTVANLLMILGFALVILVLVQRMVFRHLRRITRFFDGLDPEHPGQNELVLSRRFGSLRKPDELDEITDAINSTLSRQDRVLKEKTALVQELFHRTGNTVQSVRAILNLQSSRDRDNEQLQAAVRAVNNRILAIALAHQKLYLGGNLSRIGMREYLSDLTQEVFQSYHAPGGTVRLETDIEDVRLLIDTAIPCGTVVCELLSNSLEHAFPEGRSGMIEISLGRTEDDRYLLTVTDDGIGLASGFDVDRDGAIGIQVVTAIVETQLGGQFTFEAERGVKWSIHFSDSVYQERVPNE